MSEWRLTRLAKMSNVGLYPSSPMTAAEILETGVPHVILATGATFRHDGRGRSQPYPIHRHDSPNVLTPDNLMDGNLPTGRIILYDDDHYYLGGVLAELLVHNGCDVTLVTPAPLISYWTQYTLEQVKIQERLVKLGVKLFPQTLLTEIQPESVTLTHSITVESGKDAF